MHLQICHLSIEFSTVITFMISLSLMDNLDMNHQTGWFSDIFSTWNTFVISLFSMNYLDFLIKWMIFHKNHNHNSFVLQSFDFVKDFPQIECFGEIFASIHNSIHEFSWTFCKGTFKLHHLAKYLPHWSQLKFLFS